MIRHTILAFSFLFVIDKIFQQAQKQSHYLSTPSFSLYQEDKSRKCGEPVKVTKLFLDNCSSVLWTSFLHSGGKMTFIDVFFRGFWS